MDGSSDTKPFASELQKSEIESILLLADNFSHLYLNHEFYTDVTFIVQNGERVPAHRLILAARSEFFRAMLYGGMLESNQNEVKIEAPAEAFKMLLKYIYSGRLAFHSLEMEVIVGLMGLADQYGIIELEKTTFKYLEKALSIENVCSILELANLFSLESLIEVCLALMDCHAIELLVHESLLKLSRPWLCTLLKRDSFCAPEVEIFTFVQKWLKYNPGEQSHAAEVISLVRLPLMSVDQLLDIIQPSGLFELKQILDAISAQRFPKNINSRFGCHPNENIATKKFGTRVIVGLSPEAMLEAMPKDYSKDYYKYENYTYHEENDLNGIVIELGRNYLINHIQMLLWDCEINRTYSHYIEFSVDQKTWYKILDYSAFHCASWQNLYFKTCIVRYIRVIGTRNTSKNGLHIVHFEVKYVDNIPKIVNHIIEPMENVAVLSKGAFLIDDVSSNNNAMLNGDSTNYCVSSGYTQHLIGSGAIVVRLGQPYYIGSMRLLLWNLDNRKYSFYVETSMDQKKWEMVADKRTELLQSWVNLTFSPRPMTFIRIVGTKNTANRVRKL